MILRIKPDAQETVDFLTALCEPLNDSQLTNIQQIFTK